MEVFTFIFSLYILETIIFILIIRNSYEMAFKNTLRFEIHGKVGKKTQTHTQKNIHTHTHTHTHTCYYTYMCVYIYIFFLWWC